jgi:hypothetical protein
MNNVLLASGKVIIETDDFMAFPNQTVAQMRTDKTCTTGYEYTLHFVAASWLFGSKISQKYGFIRKNKAFVKILAPYRHFVVQELFLSKYFFALCAVSLV